MTTHIMLVVDENLPPRVADFLRGVLPPMVKEIITIAGSSELAGLPDDQLLQEILRRLRGGQEAVVVTRDRTFARDAGLDEESMPATVVVLQRHFPRRKVGRGKLPVLMSFVRDAVQKVAG